MSGWDDHKEAYGYSVLSAPPNNAPVVSALTPDKLSPQVVGATISWTCSASDAEDDPIVYRFFVQPSGGSWSIVQGWSGTNSWSWTPSVAGTFNVACHVRDGKHAGVSGWDDHKEAYGYSVLSAPPNNPPVISSLTPDKASGSQVVGTAILWTCSASDAENDPILYRFFVRPAGGSWSVVQDWSASNTWSWTPTSAGSYDIACHVRDGKHHGPSGWDDHKEAYGYSVLSVPPNNPPVISSLTPDKASGSQVVGATITWTCSATDAESDPIVYRFWNRPNGGAWTMTRDWSASYVWVWTPTAAGSYDVACHVRDGKHAGVNGWDDHKEAYGYSVLSAPPNSPPTLSSLTPDKVSGSQVAGSTITWTCSATDTENDPIVYRLFLQPAGGSWSIVQDWSGTNTWAWTPSGAGTFNVACHVRDGKHQGPSGWDDHKEVNGYVVNPDSPPVISGLSSDRLPPQVVGATITWTCSATDTENDPIVYRFWVRLSGGAWSMVRDWLPSNTWVWAPTASGTYDVACHVRDGKHAGVNGWDDHKEAYSYIITSGIPTASLSLGPGIVLGEQMVELVIAGLLVQYRFSFCGGQNQDNSASISSNAELEW